MLFPVDDMQPMSRIANGNFRSLYASTSRLECPPSRGSREPYLCEIFSGREYSASTRRQ
jgi:hypothetical protein